MRNVPFQLGQSTSRFAVCAVLILQSSAVGYGQQLASLPEVKTAPETTHLSPSTASEDSEVVVLRNGGVFEGFVHRTSSEIWIESNGAQLRLPKTDVEFIAKDVEAAYRKKSSAVGKQDSAARIGLIKWCVRHGLGPQARRELGLLQHQQPRHAQLPYLSQQIARMRPEGKVTTLPEPSAIHPDQQLGSEIQSRLSKETVASFARQIQPLLAHRCGLAGCHDRASVTPFSITRSSGSRPSKHVTQRNLGAILREIGESKPSHSNLWLSASSPHGTLTEPPMSAAELRVLREWTWQMSREAFGATDDEFATDKGVLAHDAVADAESDPFDPSRFNARQADKNSTDADPSLE